MNLKLRLERICDGRNWARLHFADGTTLTGRVLRIGQDYVEIESYGDTDKPQKREYSKHLVPMNLIKFITIESSSFAEAERRRLDYTSQMEVSNETADSMPELER